MMCAISITTRDLETQDNQRHGPLRDSPTPDRPNEPFTLDTDVLFDVAALADTNADADAYTSSRVLHCVAPDRVGGLNGFITPLVGALRTRSDLRCVGRGRSCCVAYALG